MKRERGQLISRSFGVTAFLSFNHLKKIDIKNKGRNSFRRLKQFIHSQKFLDTQNSQAATITLYEIYDCNGKLTCSFKKAQYSLYTA